MAHSRIPGPLGADRLKPPAPEDPARPLGMDLRRLHPDSPGPIGSNDWAEFTANGGKGARTIELSSASCACGRELRLRELRKVFPKQSRKVCESFLPFLNASFKAYKVTSCLRKAHFLAQVAAESEELTFTLEQVSKEKVEKNYHGYQGRGLLQLTFEDTYRRYGAHVGHDFLKDHKSDLETPRWAADSAGWFWTRGKKTNLNTLADKNDLLGISALINGAFNGFDQRRSHLKLAFKTLKVTECKTCKPGQHAYRPFKDSLCHDNMLYAFAWGAWNDPASKKKGVSPQEPAERKAGYARYLELRAASTKKAAPKEQHYGFTVAQMDELATAGSR